MRSTKHAKHAKPSLHPTRSTMSAGLTAALLPLCLAAPALADSAPPPAAAPSASSAPYRLSGWDGPDAPARISLVAGAASRTPTDSAPAVPTGADAPSAGDPAVSTPVEPPAASSADVTSPSAAGIAPVPAPIEPVVAEPVRQTTVVRMSAPGGVVAPGPHTVAVRLLADQAPVKNGYVRLEKLTSSGWAYAGRLLTRADGLGIGALNFDSTTRMRAVYQGALTRTPAQSSELVVTIRRPQSALRRTGGFRGAALRVARQQAGKPYVYGASGPSAFDCSGLVRYAYARVGRSLPHSTYAQISATRAVSRSDAQPGDLIFVGSGHVGIYAGGGMFVDAPRPGRSVAVRPIWTSSYSVRRVV